MAKLKGFVGPSRCFVLTIGNEGAILAHVSGGRVDRTWSIDDHEETSLASFAEALRKRRRTPLTILIDMLEQSYRRESIPPVNMFDRPKVLDRRLRIAYPSFDIKAALPLGETVGQRGDLAYLFVALPTSPELESWIAFFNGIDNPVASLGLLPIESTGLASALGVAIAGENGAPSDWTLLISREQTGGIRQIVVRAGKLAITRLTPLTAGDMGPAQVATTISQEMTSTLGYLTRLGFTANDRLDIVVIGSESMRAVLEERQMAGREATLLTPSEAARQLGLAEIDESEEGFGDLLHAAWAAQKRKPTLQMSGDVLGSRQVQMVAARKWVVGGLAASALVLALYGAGQMLDVLSLQQVVEMGQSGEVRNKMRLDELTRTIEALPAQPKQITAAIDHYERLMLQSAAPLPTLAAISDSLGPSIWLINLEWESEDVRGAAKKRQTSDTAQSKKVREPGFDIVFSVDLSPFAVAERAIAETNDLAERLRERFTEQIVEIVRPPLDILPTQTFVGFDSEAAPERDQGGLRADFNINGMPQ